MPIQQGNFVTQEMVNKLRPGMTPDQVRFVLGTPLLIDTFRPAPGAGPANAEAIWHYRYYFIVDDKKIADQKLQVVFVGDKLETISGDLRPGADSAAQKLPEPTSSPLSPAELTPVN
jgi:outer membrane protein assembly factor BamE